jgi:type II secretory pathway pseudopilin PulG
MMQLRHHKGFGLLEVLLATTIFMVVIGSMVTLNQMAVRNAVLANHRTQAYNLAEDALETVRQMRDTNWIHGPNAAGTLDSSNRWLAMVHDCGAAASATVRKDAYTTVVPNQEYKICFDDKVGIDGGRYGLVRVASSADQEAIQLGTGPKEAVVADPGSPTYLRKLRFETPSQNDIALLQEDAQGKVSVSNGTTAVHAIKVTVTVTWKDFDKDWSADISTILTNWKGL